MSKTSQHEGPEHPSIHLGTRRLSLDILVQVVGRLGNLGLGIVVTLIIVRTLGTTGFGQWSTIFAVTQIATNFGELGLPQVAISRAARDPEREADWLGALVSLRVLLAIPTTIASLAAILLIAPTQQSRIAGVLIAFIVLVSAPGAVGAVFQLRVRNDISIAIMTLNSVLWGAGAIAVSIFSKSIVAFAAVFLAVAVITTCISVLLALRLTSVRLAPSRSLWPVLMRVGLGVGAAGILVTLYVKLDQIQFIPSSVMTTLFPLIASAYPRDRERVHRLLQSAGEYLTMASLPILMFTAIAALPIMRLLFGSAFDEAAPALPILMGAFVSISFGYLAGNMVVILELQRKFFGYAAVGLIVNASLNILLIPRYGFLAAAWITLVTEVVVMSLTMRSVLRRIAMKPRFGRILQTLLATLAMGALTWLARNAGVPLYGLVVVAALSYPTLLLSLRVLSIAEMRAILRKDPL